jgi:hypothetical protein
MAAIPTTAGKQRRGRPFNPGVSGNVTGRPKGSRNRAAIMADALSEEDAVAITRAVVSKAKKGDMVAARLVLDRLWPAPKGRPISFPMPPTNDAASVLAAHAALLQSIGTGSLTVDEALAVSQALSLHLKMIESTELEQRLTKVEEQLAGSSQSERVKTW